MFETNSRNKMYLRLNTAHPEVTKGTGEVTLSPVVV